jgi:methyl-accepting chemotaxis protein
VASNASHTAEIAEKTRTKAEEGADVVNKVITGMDAVRASSITLKDDMGTLGQQANSIGQIMDVISDIADQTNLLALNAAIEAARAGDAGRGFAVVADEVRKLAEKTMAATKEVGGSIREIQSSTKINIAHVELSWKIITEAVELATRSGAALKEIVTLVDATSAQIRSIATAAEEQSSSSEEINRSIEDINRISSDTVEIMRQSSEAVAELVKQVQVLTCLIEDMKKDGREK